MFDFANTNATQTSIVVTSGDKFASIVGSVINYQSNVSLYTVYHYLLITQMRAKMSY